MNKKCQVFTPENYVIELLDCVDYKKDLYGKKILENSCGDGNILGVIVQRYINDCLEKGMTKTRIRDGLARDIYGIEIDEKQYEKCIKNLNCILKDNKIQDIKWKIYQEDYLRWDEDTKFQYIVGNPPYITYSELKENDQKYIRKNFKTCEKGKFDYCYAFIEKSVEMLSKEGKMSYLIPSSIFKTVFGEKLRDYIKPYITNIKDYTQKKIFDKALVKSSIMVLNKCRTGEIIHYQDMTQNIQEQICVKQLTDKWLFSTKIKEGKRRFGDYFKAAHVVATLLNKAYVLADGKYTITEEGDICIYNGNNKQYIIEKEVVRNTETPRTLRYNKHEKIIFPYRYDKNGLFRFKENEFEQLYPGATFYLKSFENELSKRKSDNNAKWYEYGRSQALSGLNRRKLLMSTVVTNNIEVYKLDKNCIPYAGIYIVECDNNKIYTLNDAVYILKSEKFKQYALKIGIPISGNSVRITSKDIENYTF